MDLDEDGSPSAEEDAGLVDVDELTTEQAGRYAGASSLVATAQARADADAAAAAIDARAAARSLAVPTDDASVRSRLRSLGEPVTRFGERRADRRERLREVLAGRRRARIEAGEKEDDVGSIRSESEAGESSEAEQDEEFFTEGSEELLEARREIAGFSLARAKRRIERQRAEAKMPITKLIALRRELFAPLKRFTTLGSQIGDTRPISVVRFSPSARFDAEASRDAMQEDDDGGQGGASGIGDPGASLLATASWSGGVKLWSVPSADEVRTLRGHDDKVGGLAWHPQATLRQAASEANLVSGAADGNVHVWNLESDRPIGTLVGHQARVARVAYHPMGAHVASASFDGTWRLWDVERRKELLLQEGHSKEVYAVAFQDDGALVCSGGLDAIGRVWDTRTGRTAMVLDGHAREVLSVDFAPNGYQVATASADDTARVWDLRALRCAYAIPAHTSSVADVRFFRSRDEREGTRDWARAQEAREDAAGSATEAAASGGGGGGGAGGAAPAFSKSGAYLATAGYDGVVKLWSADDWLLLRALGGDAGKVMSVDISPDGACLASGEWGRTFKLWACL